MKPKRLFITGIPAAGKSWTGHLLKNELGVIHVEIDDLRSMLQSDSNYREYVNMYYNLNEKRFFAQTTKKEQWEMLVTQSEGLWPALRDKIKSYEREKRPIVFEGVNLLPHLMHQDFPDFDGIVMLGESVETILERNRKSPRWGHSEELQRLEADAFFFGEGFRYKDEAKKYGYHFCNSATEAYLIVQNLWK